MDINNDHQHEREQEEHPIIMLQEGCLVCSTRIYAPLKSCVKRWIDALSCFNRIPVMAPLLAPILGAYFWGEHISLKNGTFCPFLATVQALSTTRAFLLSENEQKLLCMGRIFTAACPYLVNNCPFQLSFSWESNLARVKASGRGAKCYLRGCYFRLDT
jgi:hypothetical protein